MRVDTGEYTGNADAVQTINLTNCTGDLSAVDSSILVVSKAARAGYWTTNNFASGTCRRIDSVGNALSDYIENLTTQAFDVDTNLNTNGEEYVYLVCQYDGTTRDIEAGNYTGDGANDRNISTVNSFLIQGLIIGTTDGSEEPVGKTDDSGASTDLSSPFRNSRAETSNWIQSIGTGTFQIGNANDVNENGSNFEYIAFKETADACEFNVYAGDTNDDRDLAILGFTPDFVFDCGDLADDRRVKEIGTDGVDTSHAIAGVASAANRIQDIIANGIQVGSDAEVNANGPNDYYIWAWKRSTGTPPSTTLPPTTLAPTTTAPTTVSPTTPSPTTIAPTTVAPTTLPPTSLAPTTIAPTTIAPTTPSPTTPAPTTASPTTLPPTTVGPTTTSPTTPSPTTGAPTTPSPTTPSPTTTGPTTAPPTKPPITLPPTTSSPTTIGPTTAAPTQAPQTTLAPTTQAPTTIAPTTAILTTLFPTSLAPTTAPPLVVRRRGTMNFGYSLKPGWRQ